MIKRYEHLSHDPFNKENEYITKYYNEIAKYKNLSKEEEYKLGFIIQKNKGGKKRQDAIEKLVNANLQLVTYCAKSYYASSRATLFDLINEGNLGIMNAAERFDPKKSNGCRFGSFAVPWIKKYMYSLVSKGNIYTPPQVILKQAQLKKLETQYGDNLTPEFIGEKLKMSVKQATTLKVGVYKTLYLDAAVDEDGNEFGMFISDPNAISPAEELSKKDNYDKVISILDQFSERDKDIIYSYYLKDDPENLEKLGERYNLSKERIRQLKRDTLKVIEKKMEKA